MKVQNNKKNRSFTNYTPAGMFKYLMAILIFASIMPAFSGEKEGLEAFERGDFQTVLKEAQQLAEKGDRRGPWSLGWLYEHGKAVPQDYKLAISWYTKAAKQGFPEAQAGLGILYFDGKGVPQDYKLAEKWLFKAAVRGDAKAQYYIGLYYENGFDHSKKPNKGEKWITKSAEQGFASAQYILGLKYFSADNFKLAASWHTKAAAQGHTDAQFDLGVMYASGQGVPKSYTLSYALYDLSGRTELRDGLLKKMSSKQISKAQDLLRELSKPENLKNALAAEQQRLEKDGSSEQFWNEFEAKFEMEMLAMKAMLNKWMGGTEGDLITHAFWGVPQQVYEAGGVKYVVYDLSSIETRAGTPSTTTTNTTTQTYSNSEWMGANTNVQVNTTAGRPTEYYTRSCKIIFEVQNGKLEKWREQGTLCNYQLLANSARGYPNRLGPDGKIPCNKWQRSQESELSICTEIP